MYSAINSIKNFIKNQLYVISLYSRQISGTIILFIIAHYLSVYDYGLFTSYKSIANFCLMLANLDFSNYILVSSKANPKKTQLKISLFMLNAVAVLLFTIFVSLFCKLDSHVLFILVAIRTFFDSLFFALILPYFQATKTFNTIAKINIVYSVLISLIAILSYIFKLSLYKFLLLNILLGLINFIQCSYFAKINYLLVLNHVKQFCKMVDKSILGFIGVSIASFLYTQLSSLYVSTYLPKEDAALYFSAYTIASVIMLLVLAQVQKMMPELVNNSIENIKLILKKNLKTMIILTTGLFIFMLFFGKPLLLMLYGQSYYTNAYPILLILMFGQICVAEASVYGAYITASGNQKRKIKMQLDAIFLTVIGLIILHKFGIYGAAYSFLSAAIYISFGYTIYTIKLIKNKQNIA